MLNGRPVCGIRIQRMVYLVGLDGLEPTTSVLSGLRSNRLSYRPTGVTIIPIPRLRAIRPSFSKAMRLRRVHQRAATFREYRVSPDAVEGGYAHSSSQHAESARQMDRDAGRAFEKVLLYRVLCSDAISIYAAHRRPVFEGHGFGHGVAARGCYWRICGAPFCSWGDVIASNPA